jgi:prepilin signal peptidase PulO-like enzyme (type II secretory pathway)
MIFLQAAMAAGFVLLVILGGCLFFGIPLLTHLFMKFYWRITGKEERITNNEPYYRYPLLLVICMLLAALLIAGVFYSTLKLLDYALPGLLEYS